MKVYVPFELPYRATDRIRVLCLAHQKSTDALVGRFDGKNEALLNNARQSF